MKTGTLTRGASSVSAYDDVGKNKLINGGFNVWQRGTSFNSGSSIVNNDDTYLADRWVLLSDGNDIVDVSRDTSDKPDGAYASIKLDVETANKKFGILQIIENLNFHDLYEAGNGIVSLSFDAKVSNTRIGNVKATVLTWSSTADSVTSDIVNAWNASETTPTWAANWTAENTPANLSVTTSWARYSIENISLDTASGTNVAVFIWNDDMTVDVGDFLWIGNVQLEKGSNATPFQTRIYSQELALCKRYCQVFGGQSSYDPVAIGMVISTVDSQANIQLPVELRIVPLISYSSLSHWQLVVVDNGGNVQTVAPTTLSLVGGVQSARIVQLALIQGTYTLVKGHSMSLRASNDTSARIFLDAEL